MVFKKIKKKRGNVTRQWHLAQKKEASTSEGDEDASDHEEQETSSIIAPRQTRLQARLVSQDMDNLTKPRRKRLTLNASRKKGLNRRNLAEYYRCLKLRIPYTSKKKQLCALQLPTEEIEISIGNSEEMKIPPMNEPSCSFWKVNSDEHAQIHQELSPKMTKKKKNTKKNYEKTIVIDDDPVSPPEVVEKAVKPAKQKEPPPPTYTPKLNDNIETLQMNFWTEDLSPAQMESKKKRDQEYNDLITKLDALSKQNGGDRLFKGDNCTAYQFNSNPPALASFNQSNGISQPHETFQTTPALTTINSGNVILQTTPAPGSKPGQQPSYQIVMDPRLGFIVGTMTPTTQQVVTTSTTSKNSPVITAPLVSHTPTIPATRVLPPRKGRGRPPAAALQAAAMQNPGHPPPLQALQQQFGGSLPQPSTSNNNMTVTTLRPAESTAVGGIITGTTVTKQTTAIVDLTADDGRPAADSREVAFNKLQGKTFPSLVVVARPHLHAKEASIANDRTKLDAKVKSVLVHTPTKFTEWLIQQGLVRSEQYCSIHPSNKLNLGMYSDVSKFPYSGGYVWISECCPHRFVSVFSGSLFEGAAHPPSILLKLIYHWSCQTNIQNVVQWVKVDNLYAKGLFTWLRAVCSFALGQHIKPMGGPDRVIEVGVISLGTTSQDGSQRQVKVEVLGILDPQLRLLRLRAVEPLADGERNYKRRFSKILEPLRGWVDLESKIATDLTVDKGTLHQMGFSKIVQSTSTGVPANQGVMEYLRKIVPRMFQNTLSLLSRQIIQQFLDELVWREWYGQTAAQAFDNMVIHLAEQTRMNIGDTLIQRLNKVAANPFKNHAISYAVHTAGPKRYMRKRAAPPIIDLEKPKRIQLSEPVEPPAPLAAPPPPPQQQNNDTMVPLESYYYGTMDGEHTNLSQKVTLNVRCCVCKVPYTNNIELLDHLLAHAHNLPATVAKLQCRYCLTSLPTIEELNKHIGDQHPTETKLFGKVHPACILCEQKFSSIYTLGKHLSKEHVPQELPYQCGTCGYRSSSHRQAIDHFYTKHNGAATVQCPFCLKSTAVWSSGRIMSTNVTFFLAHLQKHQRKAMAKKCNKCALWFIQKETLKDHQAKAHQSMLGKKGVKPWSLPASYVMVPRSKIYLNTVAQTHSSPVPPPEEPTSHKITLIVPENTNCKECSKQILTSDHYPQRMACSGCRYVTDCVHSMQLHKPKCQNANVPIVRRFPLAAVLHCICGYSNDCGNQIAKHLALCEQKTAYPTPEQAKLNIDNNSSSMLDVLGLVRRNDEHVQVIVATPTLDDEEVREPEPKKAKLEVIKQIAPVAEPITEPKSTDDTVVIIDEAVDTTVKTVDTTVKTVDTINKTADTIDKTVDIINKTVETVDKTEETIDKTVDMIDKTVDTMDTVEIIDDVDIETKMEISDTDIASVPE